MPLFHGFEREQPRPLAWGFVFAVERVQPRPLAWRFVFARFFLRSTRGTFWRVQPRRLPWVGASAGWTPGFLLFPAARAIFEVEMATEKANLPQKFCNLPKGWSVNWGQKREKKHR